jgi:hypothetical protein
MTQLINEAKRFQKLANIKENIQQELSPEEQEIADDILNTLDEGMFDDVLNKIKSYVKKGLMTAAIVGALLSAPNFSQAQQQQIKQVAQIEMSSTKKMDDMSLGSALIKKYEENPKAAGEWYKKHNHTALIDNIKSVIKTGKNQEEIKDLGNIYQNNKDAQDFLTYTVNENTAYIQENEIDAAVNEALRKIRK